MSTAADIRPGSWVRFDRWDDGVWWYVLAARHTTFSPSEPRTTGFVQYDARSGPTGGFTYGGYADHREPCRIVTVTPEEVTA